MTTGLVGVGDNIYYLFNSYSIARDSLIARDSPAGRGAGILS